MSGKAPTKNGEIYYTFIEIHFISIYLHYTQNKVKPMYKSGELKN